MPFIHNIKSGAAFFQTDSGNKTLKLMPGINKISDEDYKTFKEKIDAAPHLSCVEEMNEPEPAPVQVKTEDVPQPVEESEPLDLDELARHDAEATETAEDESDEETKESSKKHGKRRR